MKTLGRLGVGLSLGVVMLGAVGCEEEKTEQPSAAEIAVYEEPANKAYAALDLESLDSETRELVDKAKVLAEARKAIDMNPERREEIIAATGMSGDEIEEYVKEISRNEAAQSVYIDGLE